MEELGWVIEKNFGGILYYWDGRATISSGWTKNNLDAIRFSRKEDAEKVLVGILDGLGKVAEHMWIE